MQYTRQVQYLHSQLAPTVPIDSFIDAIKPAALGLTDKSQFYAPVRFAVQICGGINAAAGAIRVDVPIHANERWLDDMKKRFAGMIGLKNSLQGSDISFRTVAGQDISTIDQQHLPRVGKLNVYVGDKKIRLPAMPAIPVEYSVCKEANIQSWLQQVSAELPDLIARELVAQKNLTQLDASVRGDGPVLKLIQRHLLSSAAPSGGGWGEFLRTHHMNSPDRISSSEAQATLVSVSKDMLSNLRRFIEASAEPIGSYISHLDAKRIASDLSKRSEQDVDHYKPLLASAVPGGAGNGNIDGHELYRKIAEDALASPFVQQAIIATVYTRPLEAGCRWSFEDEKKLRSIPAVFRQTKSGPSKKTNVPSSTVNPNTGYFNDVQNFLNQDNALISQFVNELQVLIQTGAFSGNEQQSGEIFENLVKKVELFDSDNQLKIFDVIYERVIVPFLDNKKKSNFGFVPERADSVWYKYYRTESFVKSVGNFLNQIRVRKELFEGENKAFRNLQKDEKGFISWTRSFQNAKEAVNFMNTWASDMSKENIAKFYAATSTWNISLESLSDKAKDNISKKFNVSVSEMTNAVDAFWQNLRTSYADNTSAFTLRDGENYTTGVTTRSNRTSNPPVEPTPQVYEFDWPDENDVEDEDYDPNETDPDQKNIEDSTQNPRTSVIFPNPSKTSKGDWIKFAQTNFEKFGLLDWNFYLFNSPVSDKGLIGKLNGKQLKSLIEQFLISQGYVKQNTTSVKIERQNIVNFLRKKYVSLKNITAQIGAHHPWNAQIHHTLQPLADGVYPTYYNLLHTKQDMSKDAAFAGDVVETYKAYHMFSGLPISPPGLLVEPIAKRAAGGGGRRSKKKSGKWNDSSDDDNKFHRMKSEMPPLIPLGDHAGLEPIQCGSCGGHSSDEDEPQNEKMMSMIRGNLPPLERIDCSMSSDEDDEDEKKKNSVKSRIGSSIAPPVVPLNGMPKLVPLSAPATASAVAGGIPPRPPLIRLSDVQAKIRSRLVPISDDMQDIESSDSMANEDIGDAYGLPSCSDVFGD